MNWVVNSCLLIFLGCIVFQDFKQRQISWFFIPLLFVGFMYKECYSDGGAIKDLMLNIGFVLIQLVVLTAYMSVKNKKIVNVINSYLGIGDILFFAVLCAAFSPINFLVFYLCSIVLTLIGYLIYNAIIKSSQKEIPLAGAMASGMMMLMIANFFLPKMNLYNDTFFISCFIK
jgi:predicted neutral ceramidase superfamily lipid hydrolase